MGHGSLTLTLFFIFLSLLSPLFSSAIHSPAPSPFPTNRPHKQAVSEPAGLAAHAPPIFLNNIQFPPPPPHSLRHHRPQSPPPPPEKLNLGKKVGLLFIAIAAVLQVTFATFLIYKRWQLKKMARRYITRVPS